MADNDNDKRTDQGGGKGADDKDGGDKLAGDKAGDKGSTDKGDGSGDKLKLDDGGDDKGGGKAGDKSAGPAALKFPESLSKEFDEDEIAFMLKGAGEAKLTQEQLDKWAKNQEELVRLRQAKAEQDKDDWAHDWRREIRSDPAVQKVGVQAAMKDVLRGAKALGGASFEKAVMRHINGEELLSGYDLFKALQLAGLSNLEDTLGAQGQARRGDDNLTPEERRMRARYPSHRKAS